MAVEDYYLLLTAAQVAANRVKLRRLHQQFASQCELSINARKDGAVALVKVRADMGTSSALQQLAQLVPVYTRADHAFLVRLVRAPEWEEGV